MAKCNKKNFRQQNKTDGIKQRCTEQVSVLKNDNKARILIIEDLYIANIRMHSNVCFFFFHKYIRL